MKKIIILILLMIISGCSTDVAVEDLKLEDLQGEKYVLGNLLGEKGTVLHFSGTWVNSLSTLHYLNEQHAEYNKNGIEVYFIGVSKEGNEKVEDFMKQYNMSLEYYIDSHEQLVKKYDITSLPTTVFIDSYGNTEAIHTKEIEPEILKSIVNKWLESSSSEDTSAVSKKHINQGTVQRDITIFYDSLINEKFDVAYDFLRVPFMPTKEEYINFKENEPEKLVAYAIVEDLSDELGGSWKTFLVEKTYIDKKGNEYIIDVVDEFSQDVTTGIWHYKGNYLNIKTIRLEGLLEESSGAYDPSFYFSLIGKSRETIIHILGEPEENYEAVPEMDQFSYLRYSEVFLALTSDYQVESVAIKIKKEISIDDIVSLLGEPDYEDYFGENMEGSTYIGYEYNGNGIEFYFDNDNSKITSIVMH